MMAPTGQRLEPNERAPDFVFNRNDAAQPNGGNRMSDKKILWVDDLSPITFRIDYIDRLAEKTKACGFVVNHIYVHKGEMQDDPTQGEKNENKQ